MLVCFPPGDGAAFSFRDWLVEAGPETGVVAVEAPRPVDVGVVAREVAEQVAAFGADDVVLVGVGPGALVAHETCRALRAHGVAVSRLCVVSPAPADDDTLSTVDVPVLVLAERDFVGEVRGWAGLTSAGFRSEVLDGGYSGADVARKALAGRQKVSRRAALRFGATATTAFGVLGTQAVGDVAAAATPAAAATVTTTDGTDPVELAAMMVRHDTSHAGEGGNTLPYALMMQEIWRGVGVETEIIPTPKAGNVHFIARIRGTGRAAPLMLLGHSDVVTVGTEEWSVDPYGGIVRDGFLYGRGALDMKGTNAAFASALIRHIREGRTFDRDIIYLADCDEEGGPHGMAWLVDNHFDKIDAGAVLTEGGWLLTRSDGSPMLAAATCSDKRSGLIEVTATARATHSTKPYPGQAILTLGKALADLDSFHTRVFPNELARGYFAALAEATDDPRLAGAIRRMLHAQDQDTRDRAGARIVAHSDYPDLHNALLRTTVSFVSAGAGYYSSIIPGQASATARVGFLPGTDDPAAVMAELRAFFADRDVRMRIVGSAGQTEDEALATLVRNLAIPRSEVDTDVFRFWQDAVAQVYPGIPAVAGQFEASTSGNPLRARGVPVYGIYPHTIDNETLNRMHGVDERIGVEPLRRGTEMLYRLFAHLTT